MIGRLKEHIGKGFSVWAFLPFVVLLTGLSWLPGVMAVVVDEEMIPYNAELEGARILEARRRLADGNYPLHHDLLMAGSSRTMADYCAKTVASGIACGYTPNLELRAHNLGNVADSFVQLERALSGAAIPRILVLEFSPHLFLLPQLSDRERGLYGQYRDALEQFELFLSGYSRQMLGIADALVFNHKAIKALGTVLQSDALDAGALFYYLRSLRGGYGQRIMACGQVCYRVYLPDRTAGEALRALSGSACDDYRKQFEGVPVNEEAWAAFERIVRRFGNGNQLIMVRPPLSRELYDLENLMHASLINEVQCYLREQGVKHLDLNPHSYYATDMSHIDWYDTHMLSVDLAQRLIAVIDWPAVFGADAVPGRTDATQRRRAKGGC